MKNKLYAYLAAFSLLLSTNTATAQTPAAVTGTNFGGTQTAVNFTGSYTGERMSGNVSVFVWDGSTPELAWRDSSSGSIGTIALVNTTAIDPDVALSINGEFATVVYRTSASEVYYEMYQFTGAGFTLFIGPTLVSNFGSPALYPNIDSGAYGFISWQETIGPNIQIMTRAINPVTGVMGPIINLSAAAGLSSTTTYGADVATYKAPSGPIVHYTYVVNNGGSQDLLHHYEKMSDIIGGTPSGVNVNSLFTVPNPWNIYLPRIATKNENTSAPFLDAVAIVTEITDGSQHHIISYTPASGVFGLTSASSFFNCINTKPVITWTNCGEYVVAWEHTNTACSSSLSGTNVLATKLDASGIPAGTYQWVNFNTFGTQETPALSGRYAPANATIVSYMDLSTNQLVFKGPSCFGTPYMREANPVDEASLFQVYPNPASEILTVEGLLLEEVAMYNVNGQLVKQFLLQHESNINIEVNDLPSGIYILDIQSATKSIQQKISIK